MANFDNFRSIKGPSLKTQTADYLTEYIISTNLESGTYLPSEGDLANTLGVGKSTVREAVQILESRGLVQRISGKGIQVVDNCSDATATMLKLLLVRGNTSVGELLEVRNAIEVKAAFLAAQRATEGEIKRLAGLLDILQSSSGPLDKYYAADYEFHLHVAKAAHNNGLTLFIETLRPILQKAILACAKAVIRPELNKPYHSPIFEAIIEKDAQKSARTMEEHLDGTLDLLNRAGFDESTLLKDLTA
jgi:GntR family transcriptional repressor for pyruvate dehydrogenase complex